VVLRSIASVSWGPSNKESLSQHYKAPSITKLLSSIICLTRVVFLPLRCTEKRFFLNLETRWITAHSPSTNFSFASRRVISPRKDSLQSNPSQITSSRFFAPHRKHMLSENHWFYVPPAPSGSLKLHRDHIHWRLSRSGPGQRDVAVDFLRPHPTSDNVVWTESSVPSPLGAGSAGVEVACGRCLSSSSLSY